MPEQSIDNLMEKVALLETKIGSTVGYRIMPPFSLVGEDINSIQNAAKQIAEFIGLRDLVFIVATVQQEQNIGGHIELRSGEKEVFVEISDDILKLPQAILATLAHEITHKYMQIKNLYYGMILVQDYENEILTDVTSVFLGLGKLMLNGCECESVKQEIVQSGIKTTTTTQKSGYLNRSQFAFIYRLICAMRKIPPTEFEKELSSEAIHAIKECEKQHASYFDQRLGSPSFQDDQIRHLGASIEKLQFILSSIDKNSRYLKEYYVNPVDSFLKKSHQRLQQIRLDSHKLADSKEIDPCLQFINSIKLEQVINKLLSELSNQKNSTEHYQETVNTMVKSIDIKTSSQDTQPDSNRFINVICWNDGTIIKLPSDKPRLAVTCPKCKYNFIADTTLPKSR